MPIFRWDQSWSPLRDLEREVDRLIQGVEFTVQGIRMPRQYPAVNIFELEYEFLITAELPGMQVQDLELTIANGVLTLKGHRDSPVVDNRDIPEERFRRRERTFGEWQRSISIPDRISDEQLSAEFNDGVLKIHLPKLEEELPRQIPVSSGE
ncbi:Hsp20/alpha crystallin family protein [Gimesia maris]|jgi:HSP20 family protein|uniref:Hsp20/alpha crystallin family protein n=1 Tax=Gimesia maris TaxID=122 RepID=UPI00241FC1D8|nr:Hsp20/alpha crystallin family protein [Gimesia maris]|tara:strand:+ start:12004 stop:12459 length:456 start_codon:yes stop_codon:yes gene_type:complete